MIFNAKAILIGLVAILWPIFLTVSAEASHVAVDSVIHFEFDKAGLLVVDPGEVGPDIEPVVLHLYVTQEDWGPQLKSLLRSHYGSSIPTYIEDFLANIPTDIDPPFRIKAKVTETLLVISLKDPKPIKLCLPSGSTTPSPC